MPDSPLNTPTKPESSGKSGTRSAMHAAVTSLQNKCRVAMSTGEGMGLRTREMVEHLERESGFLEVCEALEELKDFVLTLTDKLDFGAWEQTASARAALAKARGETPHAS